MSIVNVNQIQPVGSGQTVTINAANISAGSATVTAGTFSGNLSGNVSGIITASSGDITLTNGNLVFSTAGTGIDFSATGGPTNGTGSSELLDDYEEGTWTPTLGGNATYTSQDGRYTKVGNVVTIQFRLKVNVLGTGSANSIFGLPFAPTILSAGHYGGYFSLATNVIFLAFYLSPGVTNLTNVSQSTSGASVTNGPSIYGNGTEVIGAATYQVS
jgi:hypothetical protein